MSIRIDKMQKEQTDIHEVSTRDKETEWTHMHRDMHEVSITDKQTYKI